MANIQRQIVIFCLLVLLIQCSATAEESLEQPPRPEEQLTQQDLICLEDSRQEKLFRLIPELHKLDYVPELDSFLLWEYAQAFLWAEERYQIDLSLLLAISMHETRIRHWILGKDEEYGLLQKMCPQGECLEQCFNPETLKTDIYLQLELGIEELKYWEKWHNSHCNKENHQWLNHYNWGYKTYSSGHHSSYSERVLRWQWLIKRLVVS